MAHKGNPTNTSSLEGTVIDNRFVLNEEIGRGSFGFVFSGWDLEEDRRIAVKLEHKEATKKHLANEYKVYKLVHQCEGYPTMFHYGQFGDYNCLVMQFLGPTVKTLYGWCGGKFLRGTVCQLAMQCLYRLESIHNAGFLHQDIKPENMSVGFDGTEGCDSNTVYFYDFGTSCRFKNEADGTHIEPGPATRITGTCRYAALRMHYGYIQSRRDDLESLGYSLIYWLKGSLPWAKVSEPDPRKKWKKVRTLKRETVLNSDYLETLPNTFHDYFRYTQSLGFYSKPNYRILRGIFRRLFKEQEAEYNKREEEPYCWTKNPDYMEKCRKMIANATKHSKEAKKIQTRKSNP